MESKQIENEICVRIIDNAASNQGGSQFIDLMLCMIGLIAPCTSYNVTDRPRVKRNSISMALMDGENRITLNVGGIRFETYKLRHILY